MRFYIIPSLYISVIMLLLPLCGASQSHNYWSRSFNEESSLLSGAVVGGGAGPSAIFYNPASISEITMSKFSLHASLFSFDVFSSKNALGTGIDLNSSTLTIQPRFLSYMIKPKKHPEWSFEVAILNNENYQVDLMKNVDYTADILLNLPGQERYYALMQYMNHYRDDWVGVGGSWKINENFYIGASMFVSVRSLEYRFVIDIESFPIGDSIVMNGEIVPFYSANYQFEEYLKFSNYRLLGKAGMMYRKNNLSLGLALTTPSVGVYSDGKKVARKLKQSNITNPASGEPIPDYVIADYKEKNDVQADLKNPFSYAIGVTYAFPERNTTFYYTMEYFNELDPYRMVEASESSTIAGGSVLENIDFNNWLSFTSGARPVFNIAIGNRSELRENLMLMTGFRTDFNYRKDIEHPSFNVDHNIRSLDIDIYHLSGGLTLNILGQDLIAGLQYSFGLSKNQTQIINLTDPVEYNFEEQAALQGTRQNNMKSIHNSVSLYFGATFNFGGDKKEKP